MTWLHNGTTFDTEMADSPPFAGFVGFIYCITNKDTGQRYIGKKLIRSKRRLPPLKGKKRCRIVTKQTDWHKYWSSSEAVKAMVEDVGKERLAREVIMFADTKSQLNYAETVVQILLDVLHAKDTHGARLYMNENIERVWYHKNTISADIIAEKLAAFNAPAG